MATFLLFVGLLFVTAIVFVVWLVIRAVGAVFGLVFGGGRSCEGNKRSWSGATPNAPGVSTCSQPGCRAANPLHARFCRRCGAPVGSHSMPRMRYVA